MAFGLFQKQKPDPGKLLGKDRRELPGYFNAAAGAGKPALVILHDWFGLTPQHRALVDRFAAEGFVSFAPDLYHGRVASDAASAERLNQALVWARVLQDVGAAVDALAQREPSAKIGLVGFAMGGAVAVQAAAANPKVEAVVTFYGIPKDSDISEMNARVQGHFGNRDTRCYPERVTQFEKTLKVGKFPPEIHRYDAGNGFFHKSGDPAYSAIEAPVAWERTLKFLRRTLA